MAKNKDNKDLDFIHSIASEVSKQFGEGSIMVMDEELEVTVPYWTRTNIPQLDYAIGGSSHPGVPGGRIIEVYGKESNGKSSIAQYILGQAMAQGSVGVYQDCEHAIDVQRTHNLGVNMNDLLYAQPESIEEVFRQQEIVIELIRKKKADTPVILVWDSVASTPTESEIKGDYGDAIVGIHARLISQGLRKIRGLINEQKATAIYINQTRTNITTAFGDKTTTFGGAAIKFYSSVRIEVTAIEQIKENNSISGIRIRCYIKKNKVAPPYRTAEFNLYFDERGIDKYGAALEFLKSEGKIGGNPGWYTLNGTNYRLNEASELLRQDSKLYEQILVQCYDKGNC